jgi:hypothetical protein
MRNGKRWVAVIALLGVAAFVAGWFVALRSRSSSGSLLELLPPDADAYALLDLEALQSNPFVRRLLADPPDFSPAAEYQQMLRQTGFHYQNDLKQLAAAKFGEDWVGAAVVNVDRARLVGYLESQGAVISQQDGRVVYSFGAMHPFRLAFLSDRSVAFAVGADPALLGGVLQRSAHPGGESGARDLERRGDLFPFLTNASFLTSGLAIFARMDRLLDANPAGVRIGPFQFGKEWLQGSKMMAGSVNSGPLSLDIHLDDQCEDAASAARIANSFKAVLAILRAVPSRQGSSSKSDLATLLTVLSIRPEGNSVLVDWRATPGMLVELLGNAK